VTADYDFGLRRERGKGGHHGRNFGVGVKGDNKKDKGKVHPSTGTEAL